MVLRTETAIFFIGVILFIVGVITPQFWKDLVLMKYYNEIPLEPGTLAYKRWTGSEDPIKTTFYFWNWTNPEQITDENTKPHFVEMGPYVFWQFREKVDITNNRENSTITYRNKHTFYFDPELSNGSLSDNITSINAIGASAAHITKTWSRFLLYPVSVFLLSTGQRIWWTKNVHQLLFDGFEDSVQKIGAYIPGLKVPEKFAYLYGWNGTQPVFLNVDTGKKDVNKIGQIYFLNYLKTSKAYPECGEIKGSNGELFAPSVTTERDKLEIYFPEICRKLFHYYVGESTYEGLKTAVFGSVKKTFVDGNIVPENKCYYLDEDVPPMGALDMSKCRKEAPMAVSMPHFLYADPFYLNSVEGMNPDEIKHAYHEGLEAITGVQVNSSIRIQINVRLSRNPGLSLYKNVPDMYIPVFWQESHLLLKGEYISLLKLLVFLITYGSNIWYATAALGFLMVVLVGLHHLYNRNLLKHMKRNALNYRHESINEEAQKLRDGNVKEYEKDFVKYAISDCKAVRVD